MKIREERKVIEFSATSKAGFPLKLFSLARASSKPGTIIDQSATKKM